MKATRYLSSEQFGLHEEGGDTDVESHIVAVDISADFHVDDCVDLLTGVGNAASVILIYIASVVALCDHHFVSGVRYETVRPVVFRSCIEVCVEIQEWVAYLHIFPS